MPLFPAFRPLITFLFLLVLEIETQFVVKELEACCHHYIHLKCKGREKIAIIQSRYIVTPIVPKTEAATSSGIPANSNPPGTDSIQTNSTQNPYLSLWDMDIQFTHNLRRHPSLKNDFSRLNTPEWAMAHRKISQPYQYNPPDPLLTGLHFSSQRIMEMPLYDKVILDKDTVWTQPLFPLISDDNELNLRSRSSVSAISGLVVNNMRRAGGRNSGSRSDPVPCWSYETLGENSSEDYFDSIGNVRGRKKRVTKPQWHYKDLRPVFNRRCSGKSECVVNLMRNKLRDQDITNVCHKWPEGKIIVKYLCFNSFSGDVHSKCNEDIGYTGEGFIHNPGYPQIYAGDNPCQWRLQLPDASQKILLLFLDISLRGEEKSKCRDEIVVSDGATKLLSTCGDHPSAIGILSFTNNLNVTFTPESRLAFPKRGFLLYFREIGGCIMDLVNAYLVYQNGSHALFHCDPGFVFPGSMTTSQWFPCDALARLRLKNSVFLQCQETALSLNMLDPKNDLAWPVGPRTLAAELFHETLLPILLILILFLLNLIAFLWIRHEILVHESRIGSNSIPEFEVEVPSHTPEESTFTLSSTGFEDTSNNSNEKVERPRRFLQQDIRSPDEVAGQSSASANSETPIDFQHQISNDGYSRLFQNVSSSSSSASPESSLVLNSPVPNTLSHFSRIRRSTPV